MISALDRLVHRVAFGAPSIQRTAVEIEKSVFGMVYNAVKAARPIFITSLPRAGTTLMLEALYRFPSLAAHVYRDMPFLMACHSLSLSLGRHHDRHHRDRFGLFPVDATLAFQVNYSALDRLVHRVAFGAAFTAL